MKKIAAVVVLLVLLIQTFALAYQFENYIWGSSKAEVKEKAGLKNKIVSEQIRDKEEYLQYSDRIFDTECQVKFWFTPKTKLLYGVSVGWKGDVCDTMQKRLIDKYGNPNDEIIGVSYWGNLDNIYEEGIMLRYSQKESETWLDYAGGKYLKQYEEEKGE